MSISSFGQFLGAGLAANTDLSPTAIAGIIGNGAEESGNFTQFQQIGGGSGVGGFQWSGANATAFKQYVSETGGSISDPQTNLNFLLGELANNPSLVSNLNAVPEGNTALAAQIFMNGYEKPAASTAHLDVRQNYAQQYFDVGNGGIPNTGADSYLTYAMPGNPAAVAPIAGIGTFSPTPTSPLQDAGTILSGITGIPQAITNASNSIVSGVKSEVTSISQSLSHFFLRWTFIGAGLLMLAFGLYALVRTGGSLVEASKDLGGKAVDVAAMAA